MKALPIVLTIASTMVLAGCSTSTKSSHTSQSHSSSQTSKKVDTRPTASFKNQTFQTKFGDFKIEDNSKSASATAGKQALVVKYSFTNHSKTSVVPSDVWYKYVVAKQGGKTLEQGSLPFSTDTTKNDQLENNSVDEVKPGKTIQALGSWEMKNSGRVQVAFLGLKHKVVGRVMY